MRYSPMRKLQPSPDSRSCVTCFKESLRAYSTVTYPPYPYLSPRAASKRWPPGHLSQLIHEHSRLAMWALPTQAARDSSLRPSSCYSNARCIICIDSPSSRSSSMARIRMSCWAHRSGSRSSSHPATSMQHLRAG